MDLLAKVEQELEAARTTGGLRRAFEAWRARHPAFRRFGDIDQLIDTCRDDTEASGPQVDEVLAVLCHEASGGDQTASVLLIWLLLPGLLTARGRVAPVRTLGPEDLTSELLAGLWEEVPRISPRERGVAAHLLNGARWRALAAVRDATDWDGRMSPLPEGGDPIHMPDGGAVAEPGADGLSEAVREGVLSKEEVELLLADRDEIRAISDRLGIRIHAAQMRRDRARSRLREWAARSYEAKTPA